MRRSELVAAEVRRRRSTLTTLPTTARSMTTAEPSFRSRRQLDKVLAQVQRRGPRNESGPKALQEAVCTARSLWTTDHAENWPEAQGTNEPFTSAHGRSR